MIDSHYSKYNEYKPTHEAGYDSLVTAKVLIRLAAKLEAFGFYDEDEYLSSRECASALENGKHDTRGVLAANDHYAGPSAAARITEPIHSTKGIAEAMNAAISSKRMRGVKRAPTTKSAFAHRTAFDLLADGADENDKRSSSSAEAAEEFDGVSGGVKLPAAMNNLSLGHTGGPAIGKGEMENGEASEEELGEQKRRIRALMPEWGCDFWNVYGNKLRVNGTREGVCFLVDTDC